MVTIKNEHFNHYAIDRAGNIYVTVDRTKDRNKLSQPALRKTQPNKNNRYHQIMLQNKRENVKPTLFYVHRLVAEHFVPNPLNLPRVRHKDFDYNNNHADNLEWTTASDNVKYHIENKPDFCLSNRILNDEELLKEGLFKYIQDRKIRELAELWKCSTITCNKILKIKNIPRKNVKRK